jgi:ABC-type uncharacterized transport system ATPase subunit
MCRCNCAVARSPGSPGISGNGQAALAALIAGTLEAVRAKLSSMAKAGRQMVAARGAGEWSWPDSRRPPCDRHDRRHERGRKRDLRSLSQSTVLEIRVSGLEGGGQSFASDIIKAYDVKCPSPEARVRLLSGGNMQKLILGRALDGDPDIILASQPTRGLDVGAVAYVHARLIEARDRGAAVLLISEDLDEIQTLSDRILVIHRGHLVEALTARGTLGHGAGRTDGRPRPGRGASIMRLEPRPPPPPRPRSCGRPAAIAATVVFSSLLVMIAGASPSPCSIWSSRALPDRSSRWWKR